MKSKRKLRNFLLNGMQLEICLKYLAVAIFSCAITGVVIYASLWNVITDFVPQAVMVRLKTQIAIELLKFGIPLVLLSLLAYIVISHQIAGPIHKIMTQIDQIAKSNRIELIKIRKNDVLLQPFVDKLNE